MRYLSNVFDILGGCTLRTRERLVSKESVWCGVRGEVNPENLPSNNYKLMRVK